MTFLGMPIDGKPYLTERDKAPQLSKEEVSELIQNVISYQDVRAIGWTQYTPYFNDGEPCVFRASDPYISVHGAEDERDYDYEWMEEDFERSGRVWLSEYSEDFRRLIGDPSRNYSAPRDENGQFPLKQNPEDAPNPELFKDWMALENAMNKGSCDNALMQLFGDHAHILIDKENNKVIIDEYEHD